MIYSLLSLIRIHNNEVSILDLLQRNSTVIIYAIYRKIPSRLSDPVLIWREECLGDFFFRASCLIMGLPPMLCVSISLAVLYHLGHDFCSEEMMIPAESIEICFVGCFMLNNLVNL